MTIDDMLQAAGQQPWLILIYFLAPPLLTWCNGLAHKTPGAGAGAPYHYIYAGLIYMVSVPGTLAAVLTGYGLFFLRRDLTSVPVLLYFLPILSMVGTWVIMRRQVDLDRVPGFERLSALMLTMGLCFVVAFGVNRLFFGVLFFGSWWGLLLVAAAFFALFRAALRKLAG